MADRPARPTLEELALSRRAFIQGGLVGLAVAWARPVLALPERSGAASTLAHEQADRVTVLEGYEWEVLLRWGDPVFPDSPAFAPGAQTAASQARQFGYNCDFTAFIPLEEGRGLLAVNHEYTNPELMFPAWKKGQPERELLATELAAHGLTLVELVRGEDGRWRPDAAGKRNRRITGTTPMRLAGPAAGDALLRTGADPEGRTALGTLANCSGGVTPWGTVLTCEENFDMYFERALPAEGLDPRVAAWHRRYGVGLEELGASHLDRRFDLSQEPNEAFRFGWVVEIDPQDPSSTPIKRTALGRLKHEAANHARAKSGQLALYLGDDQRFEYLYKFVTRGAWDPSMPRAEAGALLDEGTLHVARFAADGTGAWVPLVQGQGPLVPENGFRTQADVVIATRVAADLVEATPLDRPEDVEPDPTTGKVYVALTNNTRRKADQVDGPNPRAVNRHGSILELTEEGGDAAATRFRWELLVLGGDPARPEEGARYAQGSPTWLSCPDNLCFREDGRMFVTSDGQPHTIQRNDGLYVVGTAGEERGRVRMLLSTPPGAEATGPALTPDERTMFLSIQHPGEDTVYASPSTRWPDHDPAMPPRPSVIALWRKDGRRVGD